MLTAEEASNPATAYCFTEGDLAVPDGASDLLVPLHGALVEGDDTFALHNGGRISVSKAGVYRFDVVANGGVDVHEAGHFLPGAAEQNSGDIFDYNRIGGNPVQGALWSQKTTWVSVYWLTGPAEVWYVASGGDAVGYVGMSLVATRLGDFSNLRYVDENGAE